MGFSCDKVRKWRNRGKSISIVIVFGAKSEINGAKIVSIGGVFVSED